MYDPICIKTSTSHLQNNKPCLFVDFLHWRSNHKLCPYTKWKYMMHLTIVLNQLTVIWNLIQAKHYQHWQSMVLFKLCVNFPNNQEQKLRDDDKVNPFSEALGGETSGTLLSGKSFLLLTWLEVFSNQPRGSHSNLCFVSSLDKASEEP